MQKTSETENDKIEYTKSYRSIFKATSLFGGVQFYGILVNIIKTKFVAILLGTEGMGIMGLYQSAISLIQGFTNLGIEQSAVRDVSAANASNDEDKVSHIVAVVKKVAFFTGILGMIIMLSFAPYLSKLTFGNFDYTIPFFLLSVILLLNQISVGQKVVLQGMRRLKDLAKSSAIGCTIGLLLSVPLYYWLGIKGIVPTLILTSITTLLLSWYYESKVDIKKDKVTIKQTMTDGRMMMKMGVAMTLSSILSYGSSYLLRWFIRIEGGLDEVGLFTAGYTIISQYTGLIFTAMATDYYPRLASVNKSNTKGNIIINQQIEISMLIIGPLMTLCIIFMPIFVNIIYSDKFLDVNTYIIWASIGIIFKAVSWSISYNFIARGDAKQFMTNEVIAKFYEVGLALLGYHLMGLEGMGIANLLYFIIYTIQLYIIGNNKFEFTFSKSFWKVFISQLFLLIIALILSITVFTKWQTYFGGFFVILVSVILAFKGLENRMSLLSSIRNKIGQLR